MTTPKIPPEILALLPYVPKCKCVTLDKEGASFWDYMLEPAYFRKGIWALYSKRGCLVDLCMHIPADDYSKCIWPITPEMRGGGEEAGGEHTECAWHRNCQACPAYDQMQCQGYCPTCGEPHEIVRPGKTQPTCTCADVEPVNANPKTCIKCGQPTQHMGDVCYACGQAETANPKPRLTAETFPKGWCAVRSRSCLPLVVTGYGRTWACLNGVIYRYDVLTESACNYEYTTDGHTWTRFDEEFSG